MSEDKNNETKFSPAAIVISIVVILAAIAALLLLIPLEKKNYEKKTYGALYDLSLEDERARYIIDHADEIPEDLISFAVSSAYEWENPSDEKINWDNNISFVSDYPVHKNDYLTMSYSDEELNAEGAPRLFMYDSRWGYETIGGDYIRNQGCGAVCLAMAYVGLTHKGELNPVLIAKTAENDGAIGVFGGLDNAMVKKVCEDCGFKCTDYNYDADTGSTLKPDEKLMKQILDNGHLIMLGMFGNTFGNHAIIVKGYNESGFLINDPASVEKSDKIWSFNELQPELVYMWELSYSN